MTSRLSSLTLAALVFLTEIAGAHEFWVEPDTFRPEAGGRVAMHLFVGDVREGERDELARRSDHLLRFDAIDSRGTSPVLGVLGRAPAGLFLPTKSGEVVIAYQGKHTFIELAAEKFESYLAEEGLERIIASRIRAGDSLAPGRESYARYAKTVVHVRGEGAEGSRVANREVGLPIEIVPETDVRAWADGDAFRVRVLYEGRPLADQRLKLIHLRDNELSVVARTNADGSATLQPPQPGPWLLATVYMRPAPEGVQGDWESFWGSLTFELPAKH